MLQENLTELFQRDLNKLKSELALYKDEAKIWVISGDIKNTAGNLALHLIGNLKHFIGHILGKNEYARNREAEFGDKNIPRDEILKSIDETISFINSTLATLPEEELSKEYPEHVFGKPMTTEFFLIHLLAHLNYHLGQVNYHRRLLDN